MRLRLPHINHQHPDLVCLRGLSIFEHVKPFVPGVSESEFSSGEVELATDDIKLFFKSFDKSKFKVDAKKGLVLFANDQNLGLFVDTDSEDSDTAMLSIVNEYYEDDTAVEFYSSPKFKNIFIGAFPESYSINIF
jgi:hypothetical protein